MHAHFLTDFYRDALLVAGLWQADGIAQPPAWDVGAALQAMDRLSIEAAILSISSPGVHFGDDRAAQDLARRVNEEAARPTRAHPRRFGCFASTPLPDTAGAVIEMRYALDTLGADGIVLETNFHGVYLGDDLLDPIYAERDARKGIAFIHPTSAHCRTRRCRRACDPHFVGCITISPAHPSPSFWALCSRWLIPAGLLDCC